MRRDVRIAVINNDNRAAHQNSQTLALINGEQLNMVLGIP